MYPLNLTKPTTDVLRVSQGFAVANDEAEHQALSDLGFEPKLEQEADATESDGAGHTVADVRAMLDAGSIAYDKRWGLARLLTLLPK